MDRNLLVSALITVLNLLFVSGVVMKPENVAVHIWEGNVTVTWDPPQKTPVRHLYSVHLTEYPDNPRTWKTVPNCSLSDATVCNIGLLGGQPKYVVKVGLQMPQGNFSWSRKSFNVRMSSALYPPSFSLLSTPNSVMIKIDRKQLPDIFPYGLTYTAYLRPERQDSQTQNRDDPKEEGEITFSSLQTWQMYCVRVQVKNEANGASNTSPEQCIQLPLDTMLIIYFALLGLVSFVSILMLFVCCFLRHPRKMPAALKPVENKWQPMTVGYDKVETVTDKGWLLITDQKKGKRDMSETIDPTEEEKDRRESLDSGVVMEQTSVSNSKTDEQMDDLQEDSGCGSMKGTEGSGSMRKATEELFGLDEISNDGRNDGREDSGLGLSHREVSSSLEGEDGGLLSEVVIGDGYRSQSPSSVDMKNETPEPCDMDTNMIIPSDGYRSGQVTCMCSDHEYCLWCKLKKPLMEDCPSVTQVQTDVSQTMFDTHSSVSHYREKNLIETVNLLGMDDTQSEFPHSDMSFGSQLLFSCPLLLQSGENQSCIMDTHSFNLDDVKFNFSESFSDLC